MKIWTSLKPQEKLSNRLTRQWISIGFQGEDPATDFRGAGILGLINLHYFVSNRNLEALEIYNISVDPSSEYFFASAGIYITVKVCEWIKVEIVTKEGIFDNTFEISTTNETSLRLTNELYSRVFKDFSRFWVSQSERNIMVFNTQIVSLFIQEKFFREKEMNLTRN